jgi:uncharacterized surface protein with fasciclin (FAS1) repeats
MIVNYKKRVFRAKSSMIALATVAVFGVGCQKEVAVSDDGAQNAAISALMSQAAPAPGMDPIAAIALGNPNFSELVEALQYVDAELNAGLVNLFLNGTDQFTVFAPTNAAFAALYAKFPNVDDITDLPAPLVLAVLKYHVVEGRRAANSVVPRTGMRTIETLLMGSTFKVSSTGVITASGTVAGVGSNTANINTMPGNFNITASNGIIHAIDQVILP